MIPTALARKRFLLVASAVALVLTGGALLFFGSHSFALRSVSVIACIAAVGLVKLSNVHTSAGTRDESKRLPPLMWVIGLALLAATGLSYFFMYWWTAKGYGGALPVYLFAGFGLVCGSFGAALLARLL